MFYRHLVVAMREASGSPRIGGVSMIVRISMYVTSGCIMGLRIFSNDMHCSTVMSLDAVSQLQRLQYKLERKTANESADPR
jgi:hypothetical protein